MENYAIETFNINKKFSSCYANKGISIRITKGEIHALLGENGAGKSTFMSILSGTCCADDGTVRIYDNLKLGTVRQCFELVEDYTVLENIILGNEIPKRFVFNKKNANNKGFGFKIKKFFFGFFFGILNLFCKFLLLVDKKASKEKIKNIMDKYNLHVDLDAKIKDIGVDIQQKVEILKTLYCDNDILIFDEPTAFLAPNEKENLLDIMRNLKNNGKTIIFATHKLNEVFSIADRVSVIKKGELVLTSLVTEISLDLLLETMIGKKIKILNKEKKVFKGNKKEVLKVEKLHVFDYGKKKYIVSDVNFDVKKGEIVSIAGFGGYSQDALIHSIVGLKKYKGSIKLKDVELTVGDINERNKLGMSYIPDDCCKYALISNFSVKDNLVIRDFSSHFTNFFGFIRNKKIKENAEKLIKKYNIQVNDGFLSTTNNISSGNQQKIVVAREMERDFDLLVAVQPTRGIDVITSKMIRTYLLEQRNKGKAILLVSFDLDEIFEVSDRILVMFEDRIVGEFFPENITQQELNLYMSGVKSN